MADYRAIKGVTEAVIYLLRSSYSPDDFNNELEFKIFTSKDFAKPISNGASLFLYRIYPNGVHRSPAGRVDRQGQRVQTQLPVELHFLLTIWGKEYSLQHTLAGWVMRTLEDNPILPAGLLNAIEPGIFRDDETVDICLAELRTEDLLRIWDVLGLNLYQLSIPYVARIIHIESEQQPLADDSVLVQERIVKSARYEPFGNI